MRAGNREVNIFNMSLLDILCGALGAFCFMMIALLPHYAKASKSGDGMSDSEKRELEARRHYEPVVLQMWWFEPGPDVDMYITRPGKERQPDPPTIAKQQYPLIIGDSSTYCHKGPCSETWLLRELPPGTEAQVYYKLMKTNGVERPVTVSAKYMHKGQTMDLPPAEVMPAKPIALLGKLRVLGDYSVQFIPSDDTQRFVKAIDEEQRRQRQGSQTK
jgi:hypothetical protein